MRPEESGRQSGHRGCRRTSALSCSRSRQGRSSLMLKLPSFFVEAVWLVLIGEGFCFAFPLSFFPFSIAAAFACTFQSLFWSAAGNRGRPLSGVSAGLVWDARGPMGICCLSVLPLSKMYSGVPPILLFCVLDFAVRCCFPCFDSSLSFACFSGFLVLGPGGFPGDCPFFEGEVPLPLPLPFVRGAVLEDAGVPFPFPVFDSLAKSF